MNDSVVKSVGRVFEVLELFDTERTALSATSIARTLKYPASSTVALLKSMVHLGYLTYDHAERMYFPTIRLAVISHWLEHSFFVEGHLLELMDEISAATGESTFLSWQSDLDMQFVRVRIGPHGLSPSGILATRVPLFTSVTGLTALSQKRDVEIVKLAERLNQVRRKQDPQVDLTAAREHVRQFRNLGYGAGFDLFGSGMGTLGWALRQKGTGRTVILTILGPTERIRSKEKAIVQAVKTAIAKSVAP